MFVCVSGGGGGVRDLRQNEKWTYAGENIEIQLNNFNYLGRPIVLSSGG